MNDMIQQNMIFVAYSDIGILCSVCTGSYNSFSRRYYKREKVEFLSS
jgi:hypothetical protein